MPGDYLAVRSDALATVCTAPLANPQQSALYDLATGQTSILPGGSSLNDYMLGNDANGEFFFLDGVGRRLVAFHGISNHSDFVFFQDVMTGAVFSSPSLSAREILDLDRPSASRTLCRPLRVSSHPGIDDGLPGRSRDMASYRPPYLAINHRGRAILAVTSHSVV
ncbi:MAG: hypothetical protein QOJ89_3108 [bacterium]